MYMYAQVWPGRRVCAEHTYIHTHIFLHCREIQTDSNCEVFVYVCMYVCINLCVCIHIHTYITHIYWHILAVCTWLTVVVQISISMYSALGWSAAARSGLSICMYVCMHVSMCFHVQCSWMKCSTLCFVCMHVLCMYACVMYECACVCLCMCVCTCTLKKCGMHVCMYGCKCIMYVCKHADMYIYFDKLTHE
jgi:hypothetical protein